ncbi:hypothetical protein EV361DRAFT_1021410 [Lentinula raphanica]|nr:hypothetical protein EV361DRAFT_1021410 [Lentinula raphanica]
MSDRQSVPPSSNLTNIVATLQIIYDRYGRPFRVVPCDVLENVDRNFQQNAYPTPSSAPTLPRSRTVPVHSSQGFATPALFALPQMSSVPSFPVNMHSVSSNSIFGSNMDPSIRMPLVPPSIRMPIIPPPPVPTANSSFYNTVDVLHSQHTPEILPAYFPSTMSLASQLHHVSRYEPTTAGYGGMMHPPRNSPMIDPGADSGSSLPIRQPQPGYIHPIPDIDSSPRPLLFSQDTVIPDLPTGVNQTTMNRSENHRSPVAVNSPLSPVVLSLPSLPPVSIPPVQESVSLQSLLTSIKSVVPLHDPLGWKTWDTSIRNALILGNMIGHILTTVPTTTQVRTIYNTPSYCPTPASHPLSQQDLDAEIRWRNIDLTAVSVITYKISDTARMILPPNPNPITVQSRTLLDWQAWKLKYCLRELSTTTF